MLLGPLVIMRMVNALRGAPGSLRSSLSVFGAFACWRHPEIIRLCHKLLTRRLPMPQTLNGRLG